MKTDQKSLFYVRVKKNGILTLLLVLCSVSSILKMRGVFDTAVSDSLAQQQGKIQEVLLNNVTQEEQSPSSICTRNASLPALSHAYGNGSMKKRFRVGEAVMVVSYIIETLSMKYSESIPSYVVPFFGNMLKEFRNGTGPCFLYDVTEKDFDIVVHEANFYDIAMMNEDIQAKFGWKMDITLRAFQRLFFKIMPISMHDNERHSHGSNKNAYQIDVYGFRINQNTVDFPWPIVQVSTEMFLPLLKYKQTALSSDDDLTDYQSSSDRNTSLQTYHFYMPFKTQCILRNMYGPDYMTPKDFAKDGKRTWTLNKFVYDTSLCKERPKPEIYESELERQKAWYLDEKLIPSKFKEWEEWRAKKRQKTKELRAKKRLTVTETKV